jgi:hypothetical protein
VVRRWDTIHTLKYLPMRALEPLLVPACVDHCRCDRGAPSKLCNLRQIQTGVQCRMNETVPEAMHGSRFWEARTHCFCMPLEHGPDSITGQSSPIVAMGTATKERSPNRTAPSLQILFQGCVRAITPEYPPLDIALADHAGCPLANCKVVIGEAT